MIKFHQKYFIESLLFDKVNPDKIRKHNYEYKNIDGKESNLTHFQIYPETEVASKYRTPLYKPQNSRILVEHKNGIDMKTGKLFFNRM